MMRVARVLLLLLPLLLVPPAGAVTTCCHWVCGAGGASMESSAFILAGTVGQATIGYSSSPAYEDQAGFWDPLYYIVTGVESPVQPVPRYCELSQNRPNPFPCVTIIPFAIPQRMHVSIRLFDVAGRMVRTMVDREVDPGYHVIDLDRGGLASGVYAYRMEAGSFAATRRLVLIR